jgi:hypothetical protein
MSTYFYNKKSVIKMINRTLFLLAGLLVSGITFAGHHNKADTLVPITSTGQVIVVCAAPGANLEAGLAKIKDLIAYKAEY